MANVSQKDRLITFFETLSSELDALHGYKPEVQFAVKRLRDRMRKKASIASVGLEDKAFSLFKENNSFVLLRPLTPSDQDVANAREFIQHALWSYSSSLDPEDVQCDLYTPHLFNLWKFGPGASNGVEGTHTAEKISQDMTCTARVEPLVQILRRSNPYLSCFDAANGGGTRVVDGSRMTTVPKNEDTVRVIAIEPSGNMALQLAAGQYLEGVLRNIGLDIRTQQPKNKAAAKAGSLGGFATIDMKSASDLIGRDLVKKLFPYQWWKLLETLRSSHTTLPSGEVLELNMISTMGNGFTFPLMTLILVSLIYAYRCRLEPRSYRCYIDWSKTFVFGDDVIIPENEYIHFTELAISCGFLINHEKSYSAGPFRESCGGDYYRGYDVTPFYVKSLLTDPEIYVAINQTLGWASFHKLPIIRCVRLLVSYLKGPVLFVPEWSDAFAGIRSAQCPRSYKQLSIVAYKKKLKLDFFACMLACGGFLVPVGDDLFYMPRVDKPRYRVVRRRIPLGFLDGSDAILRSESSTSWNSLLVNLL